MKRMIALTLLLLLTLTACGRRTAGEFSPPASGAGTRERRNRPA